jgi:KaiC/GvpD/RAD55 family RecA-like ATPase
MTRRIATGVMGLDQHMNGGFVEGSITLVTGKTGTGKTAFSSNFIYQGLYNNEPAVYITTEEREEDLRADIYDMFGWDLTMFEDDGLLEIISMKPMFPSKEIENLNRLVRSYISNLMSEIDDAIDRTGAQRVVIDSISIIEMFINDEYLSRVALSTLLNNLREKGTTTLLTGTIPETSEGLSGGGIIEFLVDTVILLEFVPVEEGHNRTLTIRKMRRTDHDVAIMPFDITPEGLQIMEIE